MKCRVEMKNLRILLGLAICWAICSVVASKTISDGNQTPEKPGGSGNGEGGSGSGDGEGGSGSGDGDGGAVATTTTSKASSFSQGMASLLLSLFIARSFLY
ncbi:unnamed protein product [Hymenolepis diminuta]|uniref:Uncharacterized protein n=1 Tax=Hymenolepis diminuta TaxID=6216 RepID=A0A564Y6P0_HYMDI|nr:unnamed protein product [Hymenolepis diminuta]